MSKVYVLSVGGSVERFGKLFVKKSEVYGVFESYPEAVEASRLCGFNNQGYREYYVDDHTIEYLSTSIVECELGRVRKQ